MGDAAAATAAINQFKQSLPSAGPRKNAYGQQEVGLSGRQCATATPCPPLALSCWRLALTASLGVWGRRVKAEAKRQMYLQSTEPAPKLRLVGKLLEMYAALGCRT